MHYKNIKLRVKKQLKKELPNWERLPKEMKREIVSKVMDEVTADYDFNQEITAPIAELLGIENQLPYIFLWSFLKRSAMYVIRE